MSGAVLKSEEEAVELPACHMSLSCSWRIHRVVVRCSSPGSVVHLPSGPSASGLSTRLGAALAWRRRAPRAGAPASAAWSVVRVWTSD